MAKMSKWALSGRKKKRSNEFYKLLLKWSKVNDLTYVTNYAFVLKVSLFRKVSS